MLFVLLVPCYIHGLREREHSEKVMEFCGLPWSDQNLHPEQSEEAIQTPSRWQARRPIYTSSVNRWKRYEPWLGAFADLKSA